MITIVPTSLRPFNIPLLSEATELLNPVSQIGRLGANAHAVFMCEPSRLSNPNVLHTLEQAVDEGYQISYVTSGGRSLDERSAAAVWAFLPTTKLTKTTVDALLDEGKREQALATSHSAPVTPTKKGFERFNGRPNAAPTLEIISDGGSDEPVTDEISES